MNKKNNNTHTQQQNKTTKTITANKHAYTYIGAPAKYTQVKMSQLCSPGYRPDLRSWALISYPFLPPPLINHTVSVDVKCHEGRVSELVGALSPVNHIGLYRG